MITKISDLEIGQTYSIYITKETEARRAKLLGIINETELYQSEDTELYLDVFINDKAESTQFAAIEIGIGETPKEAINNYGKFKYENTEKAVNSINSINRIRKN